MRAPTDAAGGPGSPVARRPARVGRVDPARNGATLVRLLSLADAAPFAALAEQAGRQAPPPPWRVLVRAG